MILYQVSNLYIKDEPGTFKHKPGTSFNIKNPPLDQGFNILHGEWKFRKGGMDTFSNGFGRNQIKRFIKRLFKKEMQKIKAQWENMNYNYHFESDTYPDDN